jgi:RNA polymerase sigma factor (sigma-70 family)
MLVDMWRVRLADGDTNAAWDHFIEAYRPLILATIRHTISDHDDIMEVFAHICGELSADNLSRLTAFDLRSVHTAKFSTWLVVVVRHETIDWLRKRDGTGARGEEDDLSAHVLVDGAPLADQLLENDELRVRLNEELALLDPKEQLAIKLYLIDELPAAEVARLLGWASAKTVYNAVYRSLATLRGRLEGSGIDATGF